MSVRPLSSAGSPASILQFKTAGYHGYAVEFSPYFDDRIACASSANFGVAGNGRLWALRVGPQGIVAEAIFDTQDGLFDCAWSELHENHIVVASGDGSLKLFDLTLKNFPILNLHEHTREVFSVNWNLIKKDSFLSGSWDLTIKLWSPESNQSISTWKEHSNCVYQVSWSPHMVERFASASGDSTIKLWDVRSPRSVSGFKAHNGEVLSLDWNKYDPNIIVSGGVDNSVRIWDIRNPKKELVSLIGHEYAIRRVKSSPHSKTLVASASYDMSMRAWDTSRGYNNLVAMHNLHTEFVMGVDFNMFVKGQVATCAWDETVHVFWI